VDALTKKDIIEQVTRDTGLTAFEARKGLDLFFRVIMDTLAKGEKVTVSGFGTWSVREKRERRCINPRTGQELLVKPRRTVSFSLSHVLRAMLEGGKQPAGNTFPPAPG